jgi:hypothetical protein
MATSATTLPITQGQRRAGARLGEGAAPGRRLPGKLAGERRRVRKGCRLFDPWLSRLFGGLCFGRCRQFRDRL